MDRKFIILGSIVMFFSVAIGAFGAHALENYFEQYPDLEATYDTAVQYLTIHGLGLFIVAWLYNTKNNSYSKWAGILFILGIILFSGSLFLLVLTRISIFGAITPLGGVAFLLGWLTIGYTAWRM